MKTQTLYRLDIDHLDGRGPGMIKAWTPSEAVAKEWKKTGGGWHNYYQIDMVIIESLEELADVEIGRKKMAALSKLTAEERELLGL